MAFKIIRNDITKTKADVIVNTANPDPVYMAGTDSAIYMAAGAERLLEERKKIGCIDVGEVAVTPAFDLDAKYIFHTVAPVWEGGGNGEKDMVRKCYLSCLEKAVELEVESIAFPLIATGIYGFPKADALLIATSVFSEFLADHELEIILVVFDKESFVISDKIFAGIDKYIDENYVEETIRAEYSMPEEEAEESAECEDSEPPVRDRRNKRAGNLRPSHLFGARSRECADAMVPPPVDGAGAAAALVGSAAQSRRSLEDVVKNVSETWSESLLRLITERGYSDTEVYKRANVDRKLFSKIRSNKYYQPKKNTAVAFALALRLNLDETKDFLRRAGYALSPSSVFDLIIEYSIEHEVYNLMLINQALFDHDQPQLGD